MFFEDPKKIIDSFINVFIKGSPLPCALAFFLAVPCVPIYGADFVNKGNRNNFLSPGLQKDYYRIEVKTTRFFDRQKSDVTGLVESFRGTSLYYYDFFTRAFCYGRGGVLDCEAFTYDNAIVILSYLVAGQPRKAEAVLKVYRREFYCEKNGLIGLYNSYRTDRPVTYGNLTLGIDGDRMHLGPTMWIAIAALQYTAVTGDLQFLSFAIDTAKWAQRLDHSALDDGERGAVSMGMGWGPDWSRICSTENNIDYYAVLRMLKEIHERGTPRARAVFERKGYGINDIESEMRGVSRWFAEKAYDRERGSFACGFNEKGVDRTDALDTVSWTIAAFGPDTLESMGIDPFALMDFADRQFRVRTTIGEEPCEGYDFTNKASRRRETKMVWLEGTGFHTVAFQVMSRYAERRGMAEKAEEYRTQAVKYADEMEKISRAAELIDGALPYTSKKPGDRQLIMTFAEEWEIPRGNKGQWVSSASSTGWRYLALSGFNPLSFDDGIVRYAVFQTTASLAFNK